MEVQKDVVKFYYESGKSVFIVNKMLKDKYGDINMVSKRHIYRIIEKFEKFGTVSDRRMENCGRPRSVRSGENIEQVNTIIDETPRKSVRTVLTDLTNKTSKSNSIYTSTDIL